MIQVLLQSVKTGKVFDITNSVSELTYTSSMYDQPGRLTFDLADRTVYANGAIVSVAVDGKGVFYGKLFKKEITESSYSCTCYDQLRYLQNKDTVPYKNKTASEMFVDVAKRMKLRYKVINKSTYKLPLYLYDNKSYWEMLKRALDITFTETGKKFFIRDKFGTLEFVDVSKQKTNLIVDEQSLLTGYIFTKDIDEDTFNRIKLVRSNKKTGTVDNWVVENSDTQKKWGILQYSESVDEDMNKAQIAEYAKLLLKLKNRELKTLKIDCIGSLDVMAGSGFKIAIDKLIDEWVYVNSVEHKIYDGYDMMSCEVVV